MKWWVERILQASPELERREAASIWYTGGKGRWRDWSGRRRSETPAAAVGEWSEKGDLNRVVEFFCWSGLGAVVTHFV
jgi:hypothetical protein